MLEHNSRFFQKWCIFKIFVPNCVLCICGLLNLQL